MARPNRHPRGSGADDGGGPAVFTRRPFAFRKPANDNRLGLKGWMERVVALALLTGLVALVAWRIAG